ncbi:hypothetical protein I4F81_008371 [Pyropia yezoensis]|uniref:Uncharacterized protein n=1 Tax=Pyropia yezoensis TaxID=2788 RepID=A0ACC3C7V8_PYRYE|nr:hypothetical protein I4F81_008371 [Neopyropia yezoensis]
MAATAPPLRGAPGGCRRRGRRGCRQARTRRAVAGWGGGAGAWRWGRRREWRAGCAAAAAAVWGGEGGSGGASRQPGGVGGVGWGWVGPSPTPRSSPATLHASPPPGGGGRGGEWCCQSTLRPCGVAVALAATPDTATAAPHSRLHLRCRPRRRDTRPVVPPALAAAARLPVDEWVALTGVFLLRDLVPAGGRGGGGGGGGGGGDGGGGGGGSWGGGGGGDGGGLIIGLVGAALVVPLGAPSRFLPHIAAVLSPHAGSSIRTWGHRSVEDVPPCMTATGATAVARTPAGGGTTPPHAAAAALTSTPRLAARASLLLCIVYVQYIGVRNGQHRPRVGRDRRRRGPRRWQWRGRRNGAVAVTRSTERDGKRRFDGRSAAAAKRRADRPALDNDGVACGVGVVWALWLAIVLGSVREVVRRQSSLLPPRCFRSLPSPSAPPPRILPSSLPAFLLPTLSRPPNLCDARGGEPTPPREPTPDGRSLG